MLLLSRRATAVIAASMIGLTGCYSYAPLTGTHPARGTQVRAVLSTPAEVALTEATVGNIVALEAEVVRSDEDSLVVSAFALRSASGTEFSAAGETVSIPAASVETLHARRFSALRSTAVIVAAGAAASLLFNALGTLDSGAGGGKPSPTPQ